MQWFICDHCLKATSNVYSRCHQCKYYNQSINQSCSGSLATKACKLAHHNQLWSVATYYKWYPNKLILSPHFKGQALSTIQWRCQFQGTTLSTIQWRCQFQGTTLSTIQRRCQPVGANAVTLLTSFQGTTLSTIQRRCQPVGASAVTLLTSFQGTTLSTIRRKCQPVGASAVTLLTAFQGTAIYEESCGEILPTALLKSINATVNWPSGVTHLILTSKQICACCIQSIKREHQEILQLQQTHQESFLSASTSSSIADSLPTGRQLLWAHKLDQANFLGRQPNQLLMHEKFQTS
jgi:hypothetical protein